MKNKKELITGILAFLVGIMFLFHGGNRFFAGSFSDKHPTTYIEFDFVPIVVILFGIFLIFGGIVILFRIDYILEPRSRTVSTDTCGFFTRVASVSRLRSLIVPS